MAHPKFQVYLTLALSFTVMFDKDLGRGSVRALYMDEPLLNGTFPAGFIWAAGSSAYQIEGGWDADGKGPSIWDVFTENSSNIKDGSTGKVACNSYYLYQKDVDALKLMHVTHYRFSISWPRILPKGIGQVNEPGVNYYRNLIKALKEAKIEPMVTIYHWDLPQALEEQGGWLNPKIVDWFEEYARLCFTLFGQDVKIWVTINEPYIAAGLGYGSGVFAPGKKEPGTLVYQVVHNMLLAHARAYRLYEKSFKSIQKGRVGIVQVIFWYEPKDNQEINVQAAQRALDFVGGWPSDPIFGNGDYPQSVKDRVAEKSRLQGLNKSRLPEFTEEEKKLLKGSSDFYGLNFYTSYLVEHKESNASNSTVVTDFQSDMDVSSFYDPSWYGSGSDWLKITPFGLRNVLNWLKKRYNNPEIIITENGLSDRAGNLDDQMRIYYLKHHINSVLKAIQVYNVNVTGYTTWSLVDNMEWAAGYTEKFGLFAIDFNSTEFTRIPKASAYYYANIIRNNGFLPLPGQLQPSTPCRLTSSSSVSYPQTIVVWVFQLLLLGIVPFFTYPAGLGL